MYWVGGVVHADQARGEVDLGVALDLVRFGFSLCYICLQNMLANSFVVYFIHIGNTMQGFGVFFYK